MCCIILDGGGKEEEREKKIVAKGTYVRCLKMGKGSLVEQTKNEKEKSKNSDIGKK